MNAALDVDPTWIAGDRLAVQELTNVSSLEALAPEWEDLCSHCDCTPFQRPQWVIPWLQHLYGGGDICILTVRDGRERLIGIAPLFSHFFNGAPQLKQISFVGAGVTDYLDFIVRKEYALAATEALLGRLDARQPRWDICDLQEVRPELAEFDADKREDQADRAERECRRITQQQEDNERREHDRRHIGD